MSNTRMNARGGGSTGGGPERGGSSVGAAAGAIGSGAGGRPALDNLHTSDLEGQFQILGSVLQNPPDARSWWRALWSIEDRHDARLNRYRLRHFHRWPREAVAAEDPFRDPNPEARAIYFPGPDASHDAKFAWVNAVVEEAAGNERPAWDASWGRDGDMPALDEVGDVISDILLACAPERVSVCLYMDRNNVDAFLGKAMVRPKKEERPFELHSGMSREEQEAALGGLEDDRRNPGLEDVRKFLSSSLLRGDAPNHMTFNPQEAEHASDEAVMARLGMFKKWLLQEASMGGNIHQEPTVTKLAPKRYDELTSGFMKRSLDGKRKEEKLVLLARCDVPKESDTRKVLGDMLSSLGIREDIVGVYQQGSRNPEVHGYAMMERDNIGGNVHYPDEGGRTSVAFTWSRTERLTEEHEQKKRYLRAFETDFVLNAKAKQEASNGRLLSMLWPRNSNEEDGFFPPSTVAVTSENAHMIWLPGDYDAIEEEIFQHLTGEGTGARFIRMTGTHDGNIFWQKTMKYFRDVFVKGRGPSLREYPSVPNEYSLKLCIAVAIIRTMWQSEELLLDHEYSEEELQEFFDAFAKQWRKLWRKTDETLGLGAGGPEAADSPRASREGLYAMLEFFAWWLVDKMGPMDLEITFVPFNRLNVEAT